MLTVALDGHPTESYEFSKYSYSDAEHAAIDAYCRKYGLDILPAPGEPRLNIKFENPDA